MLDTPRCFGRLNEFARTGRARAGYRPARTLGCLLAVWRTGRDSNPRTAINRYTLSRRAPSTARPPVRSFGVSPERAGTIAASIRRARNLGPSPPKTPLDRPRSPAKLAPPRPLIRATAGCSIFEVANGVAASFTVRCLFGERAKNLRCPPKGSPSQIDQSGADFGHAPIDVDRSLRRPRPAFRAYAVYGRNLPCVALIFALLLAAEIRLSPVVQGRNARRARTLFSRP